jgi:hypothetical protein
MDCLVGNGISNRNLDHFDGEKRIVALTAAKLFCLTLATIAFANACALLVPFWFIATLFVPMRDMTLTALHVDIGVQVVPGKGTWVLHEYVPEAGYLRGLALAHSAAHDDPKVGTFVAAWIESSMVKTMVV